MHVSQFEAVSRLDPEKKKVIRCVIESILLRNTIKDAERASRWLIWPATQEVLPMSDNRQHAHQLIDRLPESQLYALVALLETIVDPVTSALRIAPFDDEQETDEERAAVAQARRSLEHNGGTGIPHAEAMRRLGLDRA